jgi:hypothetical protein
LSTPVFWLIPTWLSKTRPAPRLTTSLRFPAGGGQPENWSGQPVIAIVGPWREAPNRVPTTLMALLGLAVKAETVLRGPPNQIYLSSVLSAGSSKATAEMLDSFNSGKVEFDKPEGVVHGTTPWRADLTILTREQSRSR